MNHLLRLVQLIALVSLAYLSLAAAQTTQEHVHSMSHMVMPFDMSKTKHVFSMTDSGGVQRVVMRDGADKDQIVLIRQHLRHEAEAFQKGDFADPAHLHGTTMPGLDDVKKGVARIKVKYASLPEGAHVAFPVNVSPS